MSSTFDQTIYTYSINVTVVGTRLEPNTFQLPATGTPNGLTDAQALTFAHDLKVAWRNAGFTDADVVVNKDVYRSVNYASSNGAFV